MPKGLLRAARDLWHAALQPVIYNQPSTETQAKINNAIMLQILMLAVSFACNAAITPSHQAEAWLHCQLTVIPISSTVLTCVLFHS